MVATDTEHETIVSNSFAKAFTDRLPKINIKKPKIPNNKFCKWLSHPEHLQVTLTVISVVLGVILGLTIKLTSPDISQRTVDLVAFPGELLMNMLKMLIIPLIMSSLISGLANLDTSSSGKIGTYALLYYFVTTALAVVLGIILVVSIHPGNSNIKDARPNSTISTQKKGGTLDAFLDLFRNLFPPNIVQSATQQTSSIIVEKHRMKTFSNGSKLPITEEVVEQVFVDGTNVLGLVTFSIAFGMCIGHMKERGKLMLNFFLAMNEIVMRLVGIIMWYAPFGILFLICGKILSIDDLLGTARGLGMYMLTVILGLAIHLLFTLSLSYFVITRRNPYAFFRGMLQAFVTALGTGSSAATLPVTFRCLEEELGVDSRVTRFVLPIGATVNMDGTALYEAVASIFIAQLNNIYLGPWQLFTVSLTATLAAIGAASVPSAGLVTMVLVLTSVNLPINDITLILAVDWMLDRIRTSVNVMGDAFGAGIVAHLARADLAKPVDHFAPDAVASGDRHGDNKSIDSNSLEIQMVEKKSQL